MERNVVRENTLKLKFGAQSRNPSNAEVFAFFEKQGWDCDMLSAMYREDFSLFIKFQKEEMFKEACWRLGHQVMFEYEDGTKIELAVSASNGMFKYVRVFGLPPEVDDKHISAVFSKYGTIQQMVRERYPAESGFPIWSGVRGLNMEVLHDIPAQVFEQSIKAKVSYDGILYKCFVCGSTEHLKAECPKRKSVNTRLASYAHPPVNRSGLLNENFSEGQVILAVPGKSKKDVEVISEVHARGSGSSSSLYKEQSNGIASSAQENRNSTSNMVGKDSAGKAAGDEEDTSSVSGNGLEWNLVKRLRSRDSNSSGVVAKSIRVDDRKSRSLLNLQGRRSRSLTPRQKKNNKSENIVKMDQDHFPALEKS